MKQGNDAGFGHSVPALVVVTISHSDRDRQWKMEELLFS